MNEICNEVFMRQVNAQTMISRTEEQFNNQRENVHILIAGDSHPRSDVYPPELDGSFVVATGGENIVHTYYRLKKYIEEGMEIDLVILPIDLHSFSSFRTDRIDDVYFWKKCVDYLEIGRAKHKPGKYGFYRLKGEFSYIGGINQTIKLLNIYCECEEFEVITDGHFAGQQDFSEVNDPVYMAKLRVKSHLRNFDPVDPFLKSYFIKTLQLLQNNHVKVVLVRYPISNPYYRIANQVIDVDTFNREIELMIKNHGFDFPILDYHDIYWRQKEMFNDADHLNVYGAKEFTKVLRKDLLDLGLYSP